MRRLFTTSVAVALLLAAILTGCKGPVAPTVAVPGKSAAFPATWTPTIPPEATFTATLVVQPTPTWDGTPPPPSEAYVPQILVGQLYRALNRGESLIVVDVRNLAAFEQAHIPGALHIPLEELEERDGELDGNKTIVLYCLSPNDSMSLQGAMILYRLGFTQVSVLKGGIQEWYAEGYPIEGTLLTPTPRFVGPPWTVTPLLTSTPLLGVTETPTVTQGTSTVPQETPTAPQGTPTTTVTATTSG